MNHKDEASKPNNVPKMFEVEKLNIHAHSFILFHHSIFYDQHYYNLLKVEKTRDHFQSQEVERWVCPQVPDGIILLLACALASFLSCSPIHPHRVSSGR